MLELACSLLLIACATLLVVVIMQKSEIKKLNEYIDKLTY